jgi:hypothetical protein
VAAQFAGREVAGPEKLRYFIFRNGTPADSGGIRKLPSGLTEAI